MNFLTTLVCAIAITSGIHHVYANWESDRERLGSYYLKLITTFQNTALSIANGKKRKINEIETADPIETYGKRSYNSKIGYVEHGQTFDDFKTFTEERIKYLTESAMTEYQMKTKNAAPRLKEAIITLGNDINNDSQLDDQYVLKDIYVRILQGSEEDFGKAFPENELQWILELNLIPTDQV